MRSRKLFFDYWKRWYWQKTFIEKITSWPVVVLGIIALAIILPALFNLTSLGTVSGAMIMGNLQDIFIVAGTFLSVALTAGFLCHAIKITLEGNDRMQELLSTGEELRLAGEELDSGYEELRLAGEELRVRGEELRLGREELEAGAEQIRLQIQERDEADAKERAERQIFSEQLRRDIEKIKEDAEKLREERIRREARFQNEVLPDIERREAIIRQIQAQQAEIRQQQQEIRSILYNAAITNVESTERVRRLIERYNQKVREELAAKTADNKIDNLLKEKLSQKQFEDQEICCPITQAVMQDPVQMTDGKWYERLAIQYYYDNTDNKVCPCNPALPLSNPSTLPTDFAKKAQITALYQQYASTGLLANLGVFSVANDRSINHAESENDNTQNTPTSFSINPGPS